MRLKEERRGEGWGEVERLWQVQLLIAAGEVGPERPDVSAARVLALCPLSSRQFDCCIFRYCVYVIF